MAQSMSMAFAIHGFWLKISQSETDKQLICAGYTGINYPDMTLHHDNNNVLFTLHDVIVLSCYIVYNISLISRCQQVILDFYP